MATINDYSYCSDEDAIEYLERDIRDCLIRGIDSKTIKEHMEYTVMQYEEDIKERTRKIQELFYEKIVPLDLTSPKAPSILFQCYKEWKEIVEGLYPYPPLVEIKEKDTHLETLKCLVNAYFKESYSEQLEREAMEEDEIPL